MTSNAQGVSVPNHCYPSEGKRVIKPHWWFAIIQESELHSRVRELAEKRR